jgi:hypothetical protein
MKRTTLEQQARVIDDWKRQNGVTGRDYVPVNSGAARTPSKRELLRAITKDAAKNGRAPTFPAKF